MEKLSTKKKLLIIRLYLQGLSYDEISVKTSVAKGSVANIVSELKAGQFPELSMASEQLELLREISVDLKRSGITSIQAAVGISVLSRLQEVGIEPEEIEGVTDLCRILISEGIDIHSFVKIALDVNDVCKNTGLSIDELEAKVSGLEECVKQLEPLAEEVSDRKAQIVELEKKSQELTGKANNLEERDNVLEAEIKEKQQREAKLSSHLIELEDRVQDADEKLAIARKDLKTLSDIGMSPDDLSGFTQRLKPIAHRHSIKPEYLMNRLLKELEQIDEGIGLERMIQSRKDTLHKIEDRILKAEDRLSAINSENEVLKQENASLKAAVKTEKEQIVKDLKSINMSAKNTISEFKKELQVSMTDSFAQVNKLRDQSLVLGKELGQLTEIIEANEWLKSLQALIRSDNSVEPAKVRAIAIMVLRGIHDWLGKEYHDDYSFSLLKMSISSVIGEVEKWKPST